MNYFIDMKKQYKIQLPKGKTLKNITKVSFKDGFLVIDAEVEIEERLVRIATEKLEKAAKTHIKRMNEYDEQIKVIREMADANKDISEAIDNMISEYSFCIEKKLSKMPIKAKDDKKDVRWRAEVGETFYYIDTDCMINSMNRNDFRYLRKRYDSLAEQLEDERMDNVEYMFWKKGNYFKTREAAEKVAGQIRGIFKNSKAE